MRIFLFVILTITFTSCATFDLTIYEDNGEVKETHTSKQIYVGTEAFVLDAILNPFLLTYSLFVPTPSISSSIGVNGGMNLRNFIKTYTNLIVKFPLSSDWVIIDDENGVRHSFSGYKYSLEQRFHNRARGTHADE